MNTKKKENLYLIGKKPKFLNLIFVSSKEDFLKFPKDVYPALHEVSDDSFRVDSTEYEDGEVIPYGNFITWEKPELSKLTPEQVRRIPTGYNLWNKANAAKQIEDGVLEEVDGKYRLTKIVPFKASFVVNSSIPPCFKDKKFFNGQFQVSLKGIKLDTPWGISSCEFERGFAICYGIYPDDYKDERFRGCVDGNILSVGTPSFDDYYHVTEDGKIIESLNDLYKTLTH